MNAKITFFFNFSVTLLFFHRTINGLLQHTSVVIHFIEFWLFTFPFTMVECYSVKRRVSFDSKHFKDFSINWRHTISENNGRKTFTFDAVHQRVNEFSASLSIGTFCSYVEMYLIVSVKRAHILYQSKSLSSRDIPRKTNKLIRQITGVIAGWWPDF